MPGFLLVPTANADDDLTDAILDSVATTPQAISIVNGTEYEAFALSDPSTAFTGVAVSAPAVAQTAAIQGVSHDYTLPSGITDGNTLVAIAVSADGGATIGTAPAGWTAQGSQLTSTNGRNTHQIYTKTASSDSGATVTVDWSTGNNGVLLFAEVSNVDVATLEIASLTDVVDPPALTPAGGAIDRVWIAAASWERTRVINTFPTGYSNTAGEGSTAAGSNSGAECMAAIATLESADASQDPSIFAHDTGAFFEAYAFTLSLAA